MLKKLAVIPAITVLLTSAACAQVETPPTANSGATAPDTPVIYIMRHVDKAASEADRARTPEGYDPAACEMATGLSERGAARAEETAQALAGVAFAAAYSSSYCRTAHTAKIVSGLVPETSLADPDADRTAFITGMTAKARAEDGPVLLVMHSNWIGALFADNEALIEAPSWAAPQCYGDVRMFRIEGDRWVYAGSQRSTITDRPYYECDNGHE